jgi:hypothetical protein
MRHVHFVDALGHTANDDRFEDRRLASIPHETIDPSAAFGAKISDRSSSTHLVWVEDVVLRLHGRMACIAAV